MTSTGAIMARVLVLKNVTMKNKPADLLFGIEIDDDEDALLAFDGDRVVPDVEIIGSPWYPQVTAALVMIPCGSMP